MTLELIWILLAALLGSAAVLLATGIYLIDKRFVPMVHRVGMGAVILGAFLGFVAIVVLLGFEIFDL